MKKSGRALARQVGLDVAHALYSRNGDWFHSLQAFPGVLFDDEGYLYFENEAQYLSQLGIKHGPDRGHIHAPEGISGLPGYVALSLTPQ
jgi:5-methylcytosine-specific restriction enzyme A